MKNKLKISFFEKICHVALNENEFKTVNNLFVDNDSNSSSNNNFMLIASFMCSIFSVTVFNVIVHQNKRQFKNFKKKCQSADHCFINNEIFNLIYDWVNISFKKKKSELNELIKNTEKSKSFNFNDFSKINLLSMKNWL